MNQNFKIHMLFVVIYLLIVPTSLDSKRFGLTDSSSNVPLSHYQRLAKSCYIRNFDQWSERQKELSLLIKVSKMMQLNFKDHPEVQREIEQHRLQYECLKIFGRLPVSIGPG
ncbi:unnamed protein product [Didymodactylos carnosus]|uniref:Uncharacterized protein n=1 Tax=Didymodactylos carnosus TaxID=1234261 RepID=A0A814QY41_9BILA|nr:unnamed protein product [Didymodactylos carnosus]CAF1253672.1 unnamed protein product [Didymodactylos carnosus]CAF3889410.1 unnamed protein product [Didymodactylos carnosus]CAF4060898.1 unnamed protein product [Didymodactylos carnosus]